MPKKTLTFKELIDYTNMTRKQLQAFINNGFLAFINTNISGVKNIRYRFTPNEVDRFLVSVQKTMGGKI